MKRNLFAFLSIALLSSFILSCSKDNGKPGTGKLTGKVTDAQSAATLEGVTIIVFNADNNSPLGTTLTTDKHGDFSAELASGNYFLKFYKQGYDAIPPVGVEAAAFSIAKGATTEQSAEMFPNAVSNAGYISGKVSSGSSGVSGVLVVAEDSVNEHTYSSVSDDEGTYSIFNVPAGSYEVKVYSVGYTSNAVSAAVTSGAETMDINITLTSGVSGKLTGTVQTLAANNKAIVP